jgi:predicted heme/steroid binding protein
MHLISRKNIVLLAAGAAACLLLHRIFRSRRRYITPLVPVEPRGYTLEELATFNGCQGGPIFVGLEGVVFQVAPQFYGPGEAYHMFAGREATRALAKSQLDTDLLNVVDWAAGLTECEKKTLQEWVERFKQKYPVVGWVVWPPK